ncbi:polyketide biosynthesis acyl carrier protein [Crossiella equi]|uniref:Polyketide biosynthesis acyl carrier protein n=1 Tax=Crossiella equi TaxID=130796 RepID=A0ABS5AS98_9PSEU|nr:phosphopantetheine-binding protein [Crossiella equi]MBP2479459.1 polyketide biosynthesis acyl carrier protein [Crossiella equi]
MTEESVLDLLRVATVRALPELDGTEITAETTLAELGANSLDRIDIVLEVQAELGAEGPARELPTDLTLRELAAALRAAGEWTA